MIGSRIGNYVITQKLGEGGMGEVYIAEHPQIGKRVALKLLHPELASNREIVARFFNEAKAVNDIGHPNIVDIADFGSTVTDRGELVYLVMELLDGVTLTTLLEREQLEPVRAIRIARQIADALAASHARGVVHRDLKPDNVMLVARGRDREFVKLLDFGIAKLTAGGTSSVRTRTGMLIGTPIYMSPEQCEGRATLDHRTDIYALGIVMYELLTGRVPFQGEGYGEILVQHMTAEPPPMSAFRPGIPPHVEQIVMKMLRKRPDDRFAAMTEIVLALRDPIAHVEAHGGLAGFLPPRPGATPHAMTLVAPAAVAAPPHTTLSHSVGETHVLPKRRGGLGAVVLGAAAIVVTIIVVVTVASRGSGSKAVAAQPRPAAAAPPPPAAPSPPPPPAPVAVAPPAPAPAPPAPPAPIAAPIDAGAAPVAIAPRPNVTAVHPSRPAPAPVKPTAHPRQVGDDTLDPFAK